MVAELKRLISNLVNFGTITQTKTADGKALARVKVMDRETDFLPVVSFSNSFKKHFIPVRPGEQCVVICPFGEASGGFILRSIFNKSLKEPTLANDTTEVIEYEDGTVITYDTAAKELKINATDKITIICKAATVTADTVDITATTTNTGDVTINGKLTVSDLITGQGGMAISGGTGSSATFDGNIDVTGNISTDGTITDSKGDLTNHTNNSYGRD